MRRVRSAEVQVGDVVAQPVVNAEGRTLLPRGSRLSAAVLSRLEGWGVHEVCVEGDEPAAPADAAAPSGAGAAERLVALDHRFSAWEEDEVMMWIKAVARRHLGGRGGRS